MTTYPNREHQVADDSARRRALAELKSIEQEVGYLRAKLDRGSRVEPENAQPMHEKILDLIRDLAILSTLREVREWHAADVAATQVAAYRNAEQATEG